jgi:hypothetical protein
VDSKDLTIGRGVFLGLRIRSHQKGVKPMIAKYIDRVPRFLSLFSLLGLIGLAGFFNPQFSPFSALSFLSYLCYFRFLRWFIKPRPPIKSMDIFVPLLGR